MKPTDCGPQVLKHFCGSVAVHAPPLVGSAPLAERPVQLGCQSFAVLAPAAAVLPPLLALVAPPDAVVAPPLLVVVAPPLLVVVAPPDALVAPPEFEEVLPPFALVEGELSLEQAAAPKPADIRSRALIVSFMGVHPAECTAFRLSLRRNRQGRCRDP